ncbi:interleukin-23 receptor [Excalfactoria chinensis]|uniref:interleukin-23 receptor n=1 Tax=Excalfactoria chinensis TaxID=46218 RepID=UPI003B3A9BE9
MRSAHPSRRLCPMQAAATAQALAGGGEALVLHILLCILGRGAAQIRCLGHVRIEPGSVVPMGSNVSITCVSALTCPRVSLSILLNLTAPEGPPRPLNSSAAQLQLRGFRLPFSIITCLARCSDSNWKKVVCGTELWAGYPPDPPANLSCAIPEHSGSLACTWDAGQPTLLHTNYSLHLRSTQTAQEDVFPTGSPVPLSALNGSSRYLAWVQASNALGMAHSAPQHLNLQQLVVPAMPLAEGAETTAGSPPTTTIHWRQQTELQDVRCEERHKAVGAAEWHVTAWDSAAQRGHQLQSATRYVFQARCRLSAAGSPWSAWGPPFTYSTPEAAPAAAPDVWRRLGRQFPNGSHEVTVLIKPPRDARAPILGYAVWAGASRPVCNTSSTACSLLLPPALRDLHVTAYNARGASSPARLTLRRDPSPEAFPPPLAVDVQRENQSTISVAWQPPRHSRTPPLWFIVEWVCTAPYSREEEFFWKKVPSQDTHTYIQEDAAAGSHVNVSVYAVYPNGASKPSSGHVSSEEQMLGIIYQEALHDADIGFPLGMAITVVMLSVLLVILMFKKPARKRMKAAVALLLPKWLLEDFPHMENSKVIKSFQEKGESTSSIFSEPFPDNSDPTITEIKELPGHEKHKVDIKKEPSKVVLENVEHPESSAAPCNTATEQVSDYKPQISDANTLGYVAANIGLMQPYTAAPEPETNIFFRDYSSPFSSLWDAEGPQVCLLDKINLVLNNDRSGQNRAFSSAQEEQNALLESQWEKSLYSEGVQEQTLVPDELVSCLRAMNGGSVAVQSCFPQSMGRLFEEQL